MPKIRTGTNSFIMTFNRVQHINRLVVPVPRSMIVNGNTNIKFLYQFVEVVE